ncbi:MAG: cation transporter [Anaerolineae bacterium]|nr:cation transporter [Anaerolineae bacterium]
MAHHHHDHGVTNYGRSFAFGVILNLGFVGLELLFGLLSNSLALVGDAVHNFSDVLALLLAWGAAILVRRQATRRYTYGWRRASILAALINAVSIFVVIGGLMWEAIRRFSEPDPVSGPTMVGVAAVGIVINAVTALLFFSGRKTDLNIRGAFLHMAADAGVSLGVVIAGAIIAVTRFQWLDPLVTLIIGGIVLISSWGLLRDSVRLAMDAVPEGIDPAKVQSYLGQLPSVADVHDLHIWGMSTTETALTAHLVIDHAISNDDFLAQTADSLHDRFGIEHVTLQIESSRAAESCRCCAPVDQKVPAM